MKSRSSGYSSDTEQQAKQQDLSVLRKPILTSLNGFLEAKRAFENGTEEIRRLLSRECDIMYECKVCRNVFRSLTNFISHKRVYCREQYNHLNYFDSHKNGFIDQDVSTIIQAEQDYIKNSSCNTINTSLKDGSTTTNNITASTNNNSSNKTSNNNNNILTSSEKTSKDLSSIIERLIKREQVNRVLKLTDFYDQINNKLTQEEILRKNHILQLDRVPNSKIAVYQTIKHNENDNIKNEVNEIHELLLNNKTVLGPDGKILINKNDDIETCNDNGIINDTNNIDNKDIKTINNNDGVDGSSTEISKSKMKNESGQSGSSSEKMETIEEYHQQQSNIVCEICKQRFQTEKTLKLHLQTKHIQSTYVYQCPSCTQTFLQPSAVIRHLSNDHKKSMRRIRLMRETIHKRRIRLDEIQVKGPNRELARLQTYNKQRDSSENNKIWFDNNERTQTNSPNCTYCGKKFERKAVLTTHLNNCSAKNRQTPPTISSASSSKKTSNELIQTNSLSTSSITLPLVSIASSTTATVISSVSSSSSSTTTTNTPTTSVLQNSTSNPSAFIKIEPKIEQSKLNTNNNSSIVDSFEIIGNNTVDKSKSFKHNADLVDKKLSNTLKLLREEQQKQQLQQNQSIDPLIVNKRKRRRTKKNINPIIIKPEINNKSIIDEIDNLNDTKLSNGLSLQNYDNKNNDKKTNITGHSSTDISTEILEKSSSTRTSPPKQTINNKKDNSNSRSVLSVATIKKDKNKLLKLIAKNSEKELRYFCRICKKSFSALSNLRRHISMFHYRRRKFGCKICDYRAFRKYDVSNHLNSVHSIVGDKTFDMILVAEDKTIKEDVDDDVIVVEKGNNINLNDMQNVNNSTAVTSNSINTNQILSSAASTAENNNTKKTYVQKRGRKPKLPKNSNNNNNTAVLVIDDKDNLNFSKFTRSSSNLSLSSNEDINVVAPKRPIRNRIKPVNKDFVYDLSNLLKKDMLYAERESLLTAKAAAQRRRNTVITIDDSSRESVASTSTSISNSPHNSEIDTGKGIMIKDQIKGSAQAMAQLAVSSFSACFNTPPELPTERPSIPSKLLAQIRQNDQIIYSNTILNKTIPDIENHQGNGGGFKGFDDMKKIKQLRRVSDDSIIRSLTKKRKIDLDYASLSDSPSSRLLRKVDMNINGRQEDFLGFQQFKNNTTSTATVISQQNGNSQNNSIEENINNNDIDTKITEKILVKCPTEKEFQEYLIANKLTDPVKKINITEAMEAEAVTSAEDDLLNNTESIDNQTNGGNKRITLFQRMAENKHKKLKESLLRSALEN